MATAPDALTALLTEFDAVTLELGPTGGVRATVAGFEVANGASEDVLAALCDPAVLVLVTERRRNEERPFVREPPRGYVLKPDPTRDLYGVWSPVVDNLIYAGTRQQMLDRHVRPAALARADAAGTSARPADLSPGGSYPYGWGDRDVFVVHNQQGPVESGELPREDFAAFVEATAARDHERAGRLLRPFSDD